MLELPTYSAQMISLRACGGVQGLEQFCGVSTAVSPAEQIVAGPGSRPPGEHADSGSKICLFWILWITAVLAKPSADACVGGESAN